MSERFFVVLQQTHTASCCRRGCASASCGSRSPLTGPQSCPTPKVDALVGH